MPIQQIIDYIKQCKAESVSEGAIRQELHKVGWRESDINMAFENLSNAPLISPAPSFIVSASQSPKLALAEESLGTSASQENVYSSPLDDDNSTGSGLFYGNNKYFVIGGALCVLLFAGAVGAYYFYYPKTDVILGKMLMAMTDINSFNNAFEIGVASEESSKIPSPAVLDFLALGTAYYDVADIENFKSKINIEASYDFEKKDAPEKSFSLSAKTTIDNQTQKDIQYIRVSDTEINFKLSGNEDAFRAALNENSQNITKAISKKINGQWIKFDFTDLKDLEPFGQNAGDLLGREDNYTGGNSEIINDPEDIKKFKEKLPELVALWRETNFIEFDSPSFEKIGNIPVYHFIGELNKANAKNFIMRADDLIGSVFSFSGKNDYIKIKRWYASISAINKQDIAKEEKSSENLEKETDELLKKITKGEVELFIGRNSYLLYGLNVHFDINEALTNPPSSINKKDEEEGIDRGKSSINFSLKFTDHNKKFDFDKPKDAKDMDYVLNAIMETLYFGPDYEPGTVDMMSDTQMKWRDTARVSDVRQIQLALEMYADAHSDFYPLSLNELTPEFISNIPGDPSNESLYAYSYYPEYNPTKYHIGASLEQKDAPALETDSDLNAPNSPGGFNGDDSKKCKPEDFGNYCYDIVTDR